jgi:hypothetical protein
MASTSMEELVSAGPPKKTQISMDPVTQVNKVKPIIPFKIVPDDGKVISFNWRVRKPYMP